MPAGPAASSPLRRWTESATIVVLSSPPRLLAPSTRSVVFPLSSSTLRFLPFDRGRFMDFQDDSFKIGPRDPFLPSAFPSRSWDAVTEKIDTRWNVKMDKSWRVVPVFGRIVVLLRSRNRLGLETPLPIEVLVIRCWINSHNARELVLGRDYLSNSWYGYCPEQYSSIREPRTTSYPQFPRP